MGIRNFYKLFDPSAFAKLKWGELGNRCIIVDTSYFIYKSISAMNYLTKDK